MDKPVIIVEGPPPTTLLTEDLEVGTGPEAVRGKRVAVHYAVSYTHLTLPTNREV